jgi:hypothetical protein
MSRQVWSILAATGLGVAFLATAHLLMNATFMLYDDEGYVLQGYRAFVAGGVLYNEIFTQYGPWPYLYHWAASFGSAERLTHAFGRALTVWHWTLSALLVGAITWQVTRRWLAAAGAALLAFGLLQSMTHEPSHPGSLICATLAVTVFATLALQSGAHWRGIGVTLGAATAALLLTKINVGLLFAAGAGAAGLLFSAPPAHWRPWTKGAAVVGLLALPWGLMAGRLADDWVRIFAALFSVSAAGTLWIIASTPERHLRVPRTTWLIAVAALLGTAFMIGLFPWLRGTSANALLHGVLLAPLRMPAHFTLGLTWPGWIWALAAGSTWLTVHAGRELRRAGNLSRTTVGLVHLLRVGTLLALLLHMNAWLTNTGNAFFLMLGLPLVPLFLIRTSTDTAGPADRNLAWLVLLILPQVLHAYPVAGSQKAWGTFLLLPLFVAGWTDSWHHLTKSAKGLWRAGVWLGHALLPLACILQLGLLLQTGWDFHRPSRPLGLPGAEGLRPPAYTRLALRTLTLNATLHADVLFSRPGMFSYNLWSGVPTPTAQNATHWFWLLDEPAQQAIITRLRETPRSALITSQLLDDFLATINVAMTGPLHDHLRAAYRPLFTLRPLQMSFQVPQDSGAVPFGLVDVLIPAADQNLPDKVTLLQTNVALTGELHSVELREIEPPWTTRGSFTPASARLVLEPITAQGNLIGPALTLPLQRPVRGLYRLTVHLSHRPSLDRPSQLELVGLDPAGEVLCESLFY